jgi:uroporphyrinogen-III synthase
MKRILITRALEDTPETVNIFSDFGLSPFVLPMIETEEALDPSFAYDSYDYCVLTSPAAVRYFKSHRRRISAAVYVAVGKTTSELIKRLYGVTNVLMPADAYSSSITEMFAGVSLDGVKVLSPGASKRFGDLRNFFTDNGAFFEAPALYETKPIIYEPNEVNVFLSYNAVEAAAFFSPSAVNAFMDQAELNGVKAVSLGDTTAEALRSRGVTPLTAPERTAKALAEYIRDL